MSVSGRRWTGSRGWAIAAVVAAAVGASPLQAQSNEELAKKLSNPVADLISLPLQANWDDDYGSDDDGSKFFINVQPVVPFGISRNWNLISRTILPVIDQSDIPSGSGSTAGFGDLLQSLFFSPRKPTKGGLIWGVGPAVLVPTATDDALGAQKWAIGPTGVVLRQEGRWTYGALANQLWSVAGSDDRADISATFVQPFLAYTTKTAWTFTANSESTYDWENDDWSVPVNLQAAKVTRWGHQLVSLGGGIRYWVTTPDSGPEGIGLRGVLTFLFPKK